VKYAQIDISAMPQNRKNLPVIVKFKRQSQTVFVTATPRETFGTLVSRLVDMINKMGGLKLENDPVKLDEVDGSDNADSGLPEIDIPKPSFETATSDEEQESIGDIKQHKEAGGVQIDAEKLKFALPRDPSDIYKAGFKDVEYKPSDKISSLSLTDYSVIAFALNDEDFKICEPVAEDDTE